MPAPDAGDAANTAPIPAQPSEGDAQPQAPRASPRGVLAAMDVPSKVIEEIYGKEEETPTPQEPEPTVPHSELETPAKEPEEETPPAAPEVPEPSDISPPVPPEEDEEEEPKGEFVKRATFDKRVGKLTHQKSVLKERVDELENELATAKTELQSKQEIKLYPTPDDPLGHIEDIAALDQTVAKAKNDRFWCRLNPDGAEDSDGNPISREQVVQILNRAETVIEAAPEKRKALQERVGHDNDARVLYAPMFDPKTEAYQVRQELIRRMPQIRRLPDMNLVLGRYLLGASMEADFIANQQKKNQPAADKIPPEIARKPPPIAPATPKPPSSSVTPSHNKEVEDATNRVIQGGGAEYDLAALVAAKRKQRMAQSSGRSTALV
jgi:hypothetical protein